LRIAVIGAGLSGLCIVKELGDDAFDAVPAR